MALERFLSDSLAGSSVSLNFRNWRHRTWGERAAAGLRQGLGGRAGEWERAGGGAADAHAQVQPALPETPPGGDEGHILSGMSCKKPLGQLRPGGAGRPSGEWPRRAPAKQTLGFPPGALPASLPAPRLGTPASALAAARGGSSPGMVEGEGHFHRTPAAGQGAPRMERAGTAPEEEAALPSTPGPSGTTCCASPGRAGPPPAPRPSPAATESIIKPRDKGRQAEDLPQAPPPNSRPLLQSTSTPHELPKGSLGQGSALTSISS